MGLFDVFKKKDCEICGKEVGIFGYKKLEDGEICKDCVKLLSPWFDDRRHSTVEQIKAQLAAREKNRQALQSWNYSLALGDYYTMYVKTEGDVPVSFVVSTTENFRENNADILEFSQVAACTPDIRESRDELKQTNSQGEKVSFDPPRYEYRYDFSVKLDIQGCPYIDDMRFRINASTVRLETVMPRGALLGAFQSFAPMLYPEYRHYKAMLDELCEIVSCGQRGVARAARPAVETAPAPQVQEPAPIPADTWKCESCGSENTGKFCQGCGAPKPAPAQPAANWTCVCGTVNTGKFCQNCGTKQFTINDIECSECSWRAEPGDVFTGYCPSCDHKFGPEDLDI